jgi:hypothetical protein
MKPDDPILDHMRLVVETLVTHPGPIRARLQAAEPHFRTISESEMRTPVEWRLKMRIGSGLVEGGDEDESSDIDVEASDAEVAESIALLDEARAVQIAGDMLRLYEILAGLRTDDDYGRGRGSV